ncbi:16S rRNA (uracil(1498)-N(3))-methyltransferase [Agaribacterium sp. ZY112]|uniref:16S rRNA (uracil(1498)-N(3))-methyltransferase n=1 Tax=Agaribacterium sp. ZY112 TaxID=3233574 RepID=UPI0035256BF0
MNTLILEQEAFISEFQCQLSVRQLQHIQNVLKSHLGDQLTVAKLNGAMGTACLAEKQGQLILTDIRLESDAPRQLPLSLILALPRPQMLKRILQTVACFGVQHLHLIHSNRVEKSFWQSPSATDEAIKEQLILGVEQAKASQLPTVSKHRRFKTFIEDYAPEIIRNKKATVAHPGPYPLFETERETPKIIAIGPEGGFSDYEIERFVEQGFETRQLGERILKVETAVTALLGRCL